ESFRSVQRGWPFVITKGLIPTPPRRRDARHHNGGTRSVGPGVPRSAWERGTVWQAGRLHHNGGTPTPQWRDAERRTARPPRRARERGNFSLVSCQWPVGCRLLALRTPLPGRNRVRRGPEAAMVGPRGALGLGQFERVGITD